MQIKTNSSFRMLLVLPFLSLPAFANSMAIESAQDRAEKLISSWLQTVETSTTDRNDFNKLCKIEISTENGLTSLHVSKAEKSIHLRLTNSDSTETPAVTILPDSVTVITSPGSEPYSMIKLTLQPWGELEAQAYSAAGPEGTIFTCHFPKK